MIKFFKREFGPYFRGFSEYDFKFFRTFRDSFYRPNDVIESKVGRYTGELKFTFNVFTILFVVFYLYNSTWVEDIGFYQMWKYPIPHQQYLRLSHSLEEDYYGYLTALAFIPFYFISLKLLFYRKKPWGYFLSAAFYLTSVIFTLLISSILLLNILGIESEFIIVPIVSTIVVYPVIALRIQHWFWSLIKGILAAAIPLVLSSPFTIEILDNLVINIIQNEEVLEVQPSNNKVLKSEILEIEPGGIQQAIVLDSTQMIVLGYDNLTWFDNKIVSKQITLKDYHEKKMQLLSSEGPIVIVCFHKKDESINEGVITLYSMKGDTLWNHRLLPRNNLKLLSTVSSEDGYSIFAMGYKIDLEGKIPNWNVSIKEDSLFHEEIQYFSSDVGTIKTISKRGKQHVASYSLQLINSLGTNSWNNDLYLKTSPFDPIDELSVILDSTNNKIYAHYTLANDSTYQAHIYSIDLYSGEVDWNKTFTIPAHVVEYEGMTMDNKYIYLFGEAHKFYSEWFWQPTYHVGLLVKIDKVSGDKVNHIFLGPTDNWGAHSDIHQVYPNGESLYLLMFDRYRESYFGEDTDELLLKEISRDF